VNYPQIWGNVFQGEIMRMAPSTCLPSDLLCDEFQPFFEAKNILRRKYSVKISHFVKKNENLFLEFPNFVTIIS
jgi:hypothetical protein